jgi:hypothetical protein
MLLLRAGRIKVHFFPFRKKKNKTKQNKTKQNKTKQNKTKQKTFPPPNPHRHQIQSCFAVSTKHRMTAIPCSHPQSRQHPRTDRDASRRLPTQLT